MAANDPVLLDLPRAIETERLHMRPPRAGDGELLFEAIAESLGELRRFLAALPWVADEQSVASSEAWCRNSAANFMSRKDLPFLIFEAASGQLLGATGLHRMDWDVPKAEIGYWCRTSRSRQGFVSEAVNAVAMYGLGHLAARRLEIITDEGNASSRRVAERCGFTLEGVLHSQRRASSGELRNMCVYARLPAR